MHWQLTKALSVATALWVNQALGYPFDPLLNALVVFLALLLVDYWIAS